MRLLEKISHPMGLFKNIRKPMGEEIKLNTWDKFQRWGGECNDYMIQFLNKGLNA